MYTDTTSSSNKLSVFVKTFTYYQTFTNYRQEIDQYKTKKQKSKSANRKKQKYKNPDTLTEQRFMKMHFSTSEVKIVVCCCCNRQRGNTKECHICQNS